MHSVVDDATVVGGVALLEELPARMSAVELQIVQLRSEMREQFSSVRIDLGADIKAAYDEVPARFATIEEGRPRRRQR